MNYYNEFDPYAAQWLRNLIEAGHIPQGEVDSRSIKDVRASDLTGYVQCHFFAGLGGWSHALRLAGWPEDRPVWTGSCPCQPFSAAGAQKGTADDRHLWPTWFNLIRECRPDVIFGEQVEAAINHGWLDLVQSDLEGEGYACGAVGIPAGGVGAPHIRQRLWFVADAQSVGRSIQHTPHDGSANAPSNTLANANDSVADQRRSDIGELGNTPSAGRRTGGSDGRGDETSDGRDTAQRGASGAEARRAGVADGELADTSNNGHLAADGLRETLEPSWEARAHGVGQSAGSCDVSELADTQHAERGAERQIDTDAHGRDGLGRGGDVSELADANSGRHNRWATATGRQAGASTGIASSSASDQLADTNGTRSAAGVSGQEYGEERVAEVTHHGGGGESGAGQRSETFWSDCDWLPCRDGKARPVEPGTFPLAHGVSARVGRLRAYGNAIVPQVAQAFIEAYLES